MRNSTSSVSRLLVTTAIAALALVLWTAEPAEAHGGRIKPKPPRAGGGVEPDPKWPKPPRRPSPPPTTPKWPTPPTPPPPTPPPTTPGGPGGGVPPGGGKPTTPPPTPPKPLTPTPTTPQGPGATPGAPPPPTGGRPQGNSLGRRRPAAGGGLDTDWQAWWDLNRWRFFPERGDQLLRAGAVVTPAPDEFKKDDPRVIAERRRDMVARAHIIPFLLRQLDPKLRVRDEIRAASMIALAKISTDVETVDVLLRYAENQGESNLVRESAAIAAGYLRRTTEARRLPGEALDKARARLLAVVDDDKAPVRTRAFAALAIGFLGDQPHGSAFSKDGRVITRDLWTRLQKKYKSREVPVALLTAIGMQPAVGTSDEIKKGLQGIAFGRRVHRMRWDDFERAHALNALIRQEGPGWPVALCRTITTKRIPASVRRAAFIALGANTDSLSPADRLTATEAALKGIRYGRDTLTRGLGQIAIGRLLGADMRAGSAALLDRTNAGDYLLGEARKGPQPVRGFATLGLGLAVRGSTLDDPSVKKFKTEASALFLRCYERTGDPMVKGAYAVAMGLAGDAATPVVDTLAATLGDRGADPALRGHAAISLGQLGVRTLPVRRALHTALLDRRTVALRSEAALSLSFLGGDEEATMLIQELRNARSQWVLSQIAAALGHLGDLKAVPAIMEIAADERRAEEARALAIASLGLLCDPEPKPSSLRLTFDANYPSRTDALHEAFTIL